MKKAVGQPREEKPTASDSTSQNRSESMQTLAVPAKNVKAFYATVYDAPARLVKVDGVIYVVTDDDVQVFEVEIAPFTVGLNKGTQTAIA
jgi:hypothetical protein